MTDAEVQKHKQIFEEHLLEVQAAFNAQSDARGLGVQLDVSYHDLE